MSKKFMTDEMILSAYSRHYSEPLTSVEALKNVLVHEAETCPTIDQRVNQLELNFLNSAPQERTVQHPSLREFIQAARLKGEAWEEIAKNADAIFGIALSETTVRRAVGGRS
jgi:hypothetical protein